EVEHDRSGEGDVDRAADALGLEIVDVAHHPLDAGAERFGRDAKAPAELDVPFARPALQALTVERRPLRCVDGLDVHRHGLRSAALELEGPEAVEGADVERALA